MSQKIALSKSGVNVLTATDADDFVFHSDYDTLKYESQGVVTVTTNKANYYHFEPASGPFPDFYYHYTVETIAHGLGYTPYFIGYLIDIPVGGAIQCPFAFGDAGFFSYLSVFADATNLYFVSDFDTTDNTGTVDDVYGYRIFKNDLGL